MLEIVDGIKIELANNKGITISWDKVDRSDGYYIYRRTKNTSWKVIKKTENRFYVDKSADTSIQYYYAVCPYCEFYSKIYKGTYDKNGIKAPIINPVPNGMKFKYQEHKIAKNGTDSIELVDYYGDKNNIKWESDNTQIATVDTSGKIKGINYGKATISATAYGQTCSCLIIVDKFLQTDNTEYTLTVAKTIDINWICGSKQNDKISYEIEDDDIVGCKWDKGDCNEGYAWTSKLIVTPKSNGTTNIKIKNTLNNEILVLRITVQNVKVLSVDKSRIVISDEDVILITSTTGGAFSWSNDNVNVATCKLGEWNNDNTIPLYITPVSNGTSTITITDKKTRDTVVITVTVTGLKSNIIDNYNKLRNYIETNGYTNSNGNRFIKYNKLIQGIDVTFAIIYEKVQNRFEFLMLWNQSGVSTISSLYVYPSDSPIIQAEFSWNLENEQIFETRSIQTYAGAYSGSNLVFNVVQTTGEISISDIRQQSQQFVKLLCSGCDGYLLNPIGINLNKLGFSKFS